MGRANRVDVNLSSSFSEPSRSSRMIQVNMGHKDIGDILGLSSRTVNKHLEQIYAKLGVENRASAAVKAAGVLRET